MPFRYPVALELTGRKCVVIGGGKTAEQKVQGLLDAGGDVVVITEQASDLLEKWSEERRIELVHKPYSYGDLEGAFIAIAGSEDRLFNAEIYKEAEERNVLLNAVDDVPHCHFAAPSIVRRSDFLLAISTGGKAPALAKKLRKELSEQFGPEYGRLVELLGRMREKLLPRRKVDFDTWAARWGDAMSEDLIGLVREGRLKEAEERVAALVGEAGPAVHEQGEGHQQPKEQSADPVDSGIQTAGKVWIVGAGPGDPGLITVAGRQAVEAADVIVADRLVNPDLVAGKEVIYAGKEPGTGQVAQHEINDLLVRLARAGRRVVRLKGGDPFLFGRGAEEAEALSDAGIEFSVVPGTTSAIAAVAAAGIPVTDRRFSSSVVIVTGHSAGSSTEGPQPDFRALAGSAGTIVVLMGISNLDEIASELIAGGRDVDEPAAIIENGTLPSQRVIESTLGDLRSASAAAGVRPPAIVVIGNVVSLRKKIAL